MCYEMDPDPETIQDDSLPQLQTHIHSTQAEPGEQLPQVAGLPQPQPHIHSMQAEPGEQPPGLPQPQPHVHSMQAEPGEQLPQVPPRLEAGLPQPQPHVHSMQAEPGEQPSQVPPRLEASFRQPQPHVHSMQAEPGEQPPQVPPRLEASFRQRQVIRIRDMRALAAIARLTPAQRAALVQTRTTQTQMNPHGYECEFSTPSEDLQLLQTKCPICLLILRKPHMVTCCCHKFCESCIKHVITIDSRQTGGNRFTRRQRPCPYCNAATYTIVHEKDLERTLNGLNVHCSYQKDGCEWTGELGKLDQHLNETPIEENQLEGCQYVEIKCACGCDNRFQRSVIQEHQTECSKRLLTCMHCQKFSSTYQEVKMAHWPECDSFPTSCPNACGVHTFKRMDLQKHVSTCPLQMVNCDFHQAGCSTRSKRKSMADHMKVSMAIHLSLIANQNARMMQELDECKQRIKALEQEKRQNVASEGPPALVEPEVLVKPDSECDPLTNRQ